MVKRGEFLGQRECIYKGNEKQHVWHFWKKGLNSKVDVFLDWENGQGPGMGGFYLSYQEA